MKTSALFALAVAGGAQLAAAHTTVWEIAVNGKAQGVGNKQGGYIDSPPNNSPIVDVTSKDMTCNVANIKATSSVSVAAGDEITFEWHHDSNQASDDIIATSHHGPIMVYISKAGSSLSWTKIAEDGYDGKSWAVDKLIAGSYTGKPGQHKAKLPANLAPGDYILRPEIIALHEGNRAAGAQFYMECVHVKVGGSGTVALPAGVSIPGAYKATDPGVLFDIYNAFSSYPIPGPKVWNGSGSGSAPAPAPVTTKAPAASTPTPTKAPAPAVTSAKPATPKPTTLVTSAKPAATAGAGSGSGTAQRWGQCGGKGYTGPTACVSGTKCQVQNDWYSQCL